MTFRIVIAAAVLAMSAGASQAATTLAKPMAKGVKCGDSYIAAGKTCAKAPPAAMGKGVKCGDSYIAAGQVCHKPTAMAAPTKPMATPTKMAAATPMKAPMAKGKKCGNSYIAANATCTKK